MTLRNFALGYGVVFLVVGVLGFIPGFLQPPPAGAPDLAVGTLYGSLLALFPVNILHDLTHVAFGVWGLAAYRGATSALMYARGVAIIYAVLAVMGLIPVLNTTFGLIPLFGHDVWLHALLAAGAAYFGWMAPAASAERGASLT